LVPDSKYSFRMEMPGRLFDATCFTPSMPLDAASSGSVTSSSTCSGDRPGASVCTFTILAANSGNTSVLAWREKLTASAANITASVSTTPRR